MKGLRYQIEEAYGERPRLVIALKAITSNGTTNHRLAQALIRSANCPKPEGMPWHLAWDVGFANDPVAVDDSGQHTLSQEWVREVHDAAQQHLTGLLDEAYRHRFYGQIWAEVDNRPAAAPA